MVEEWFCSLFQLGRHDISTFCLINVLLCIMRPDKVCLWVLLSLHQPFKVCSVGLLLMRGLLILLVIHCLLFVNSVDLSYFFESWAWSLNYLVLTLAKWGVAYVRVSSRCLGIVEARYLYLLVCDDFHGSNAEAEILRVNLLRRGCQ